MDFAAGVYQSLCNGGALYALYSFLRFSNMLCEGRVLAQWEGGGRGETGW